MKKLLSVSLILLFLSSVLAGQGINPGDQLADQQLPDTGGKMHKLSEYASKKTIVLLFISVKCPVSNAYNGRIAKLVADYAGKGVQFLGVNADGRETVAEIAAHAKENGFNFPILKDAEGTLTERLDATVTPEAYVFSSDLTLLYHGRIDDSQRASHVKRSDLAVALDQIIAGEAVSTQITKAFGCRIKRGL